MAFGKDADVVSIVVLSGNSEKKHFFLWKITCWLQKPGSFTLVRESVFRIEYFTGGKNCSEQLLARTGKYLHYIIETK